MGIGHAARAGPCLALEAPGLAPVPRPCPTPSVLPRGEHQLSPTSEQTQQTREHVGPFFRSGTEA